MIFKVYQKLLFPSDWLTLLLNCDICDLMLQLCLSISVSAVKLSSFVSLCYFSMKRYESKG